MFSFCFIELKQMSNKLEKLFLSKLPSVLFVQRTQIGVGGAANRVHLVTFTPGMSPGFSSLKVRTNGRKTVHSGI